MLNSTRQYLKSVFDSSRQSSMLTLSSRENDVVYVIPTSKASFHNRCYLICRSVCQHHLDLIINYMIQRQPDTWKKKTKMFLHLEVCSSSYREKATQCQLRFLGYLQLLSLCPALITALMMTNWPHHECLGVSLLVVVELMKRLADTRCKPTLSSWRKSAQFKT